MVQYQVEEFLLIFNVTHNQDHEGKADINHSGCFWDGCGVGVRENREISLT